MIVIEFLDGQGLGNQLWVYAAGRSIARKLGYPYFVQNWSKFNGRTFLDLEHGDSVELQEYLRSVSLGSTPQISIFREKMYFDHNLKYFATDYDSSVLNLKPFTKLEGLFQSEKYFFGNAALPQQFVRLKEEFSGKQLIPEGCCVLNLRGGEYKRHKNLILPKSYWKNAMRNMRDLRGIDNFLVVTDDRRYAKALLPELPVLDGGIAECYVALYQAENLILSNSSFAYFPVKTGGRKSLVIAPMLWARFGNEFRRWASPANLYDSWHWQDPIGALHDYADCQRLRDITVRYYHDNYIYSVSKELVTRRALTGYLTPGIRRQLKKLLSYIAPKQFG